MRSLKLIYYLNLIILGVICTATLHCHFKFAILLFYFVLKFEFEFAKVQRLGFGLVKILRAQVVILDTHKLHIQTAQI